MTSAGTREPASGAALGPGAATVPAIEVLSAEQTYPDGTRALQPVALTVAEGEFVTLLGPSGCGKSTLLRMVAGLLEPSGGRLTLWGRPVRELGASGRRIAFVFQAPTLMPWASVDDQRAPAARPGRASTATRPMRGSPRCSPWSAWRSSRRRCRASLSGGMQMRVSIARALVVDPHLLLMDEPFGALDEITRSRLDGELLELWRSKGLTVLFVTHSIHEAVFLSNRVVVMAARPGRVIEEIAIDEPYPRSAGFMVTPQFSRHAQRLQDSLLRASAEIDRVASAEAPSVPHERPAPARRAAEGGPFRRILYPALVAVALLAAWQAAVVGFELPPYLVPSPARVARTLVADRVELGRALLTTVEVTVLAFLVAVVVGVLVVVRFRAEPCDRDRLLPVRGAAAGDADRRRRAADHHLGQGPDRLRWCSAPRSSRSFPMIANTTLGLRSVDPGLQSYFRLNHASRRQTLLRLRIPSALPYFFGGLRISSGLALIGAVVAEFVAGTGGASAGLAYQILQAGFQLDIPRMFAALLLISVTGMAMFAGMSWVSRAALGSWHASERSTD